VAEYSGAAWLLHLPVSVASAEGLFTPADSRIPGWQGPDHHGTYWQESSLNARDDGARQELWVRTLLCHRDTGIEIRVTITNHTARNLHNVAVALATEGGKKLALTLPFGDLPAGDYTTATALLALADETAKTVSLTVL